MRDTIGWLQVDAKPSTEFLELEERRVLDHIEEILISHRLLKLGSDQLIRVIGYRDWCLKECIAFDEAAVSDKFAELVALARNFDECEEYFVERLRVNNTTVWRWSLGRNRPAKLLGPIIVRDLRIILISVISDILDELEQAEEPSMRAN